MRVEVTLGEVLTVALVIYVLSPVDCMSESSMGARGLIDDLIVIWILAMGFAAWFTLVIVLFETSTSRPVIHSNGRP